MRRIALTIIGLLISLVAIYLVLRSVDVRQTLDTLARAQAVPVLAALPLIAAGIALRSVRWQRLLARDAFVPVLRIVPVLLIGYLGNAVLPARLGEPIRAYVLARREGLSSAQVFGTALLERIVDLATLAVMAFVVALTLHVPAWVVQLMGIAALGGGGVVIFLAWVGLEPPVAALRRVIGGDTGLRKGLVAALERFARGMGGQAQRLPIGQAVALSVPIWLIDGTICWLVAQSLGLGLALSAALLVTGVGALGTSVPSAPGYIGTYELAVSATARGLGVSPEGALGLALLLHATTLLPIALGGAVSMLTLGDGNLLALARAAEAGERRG